MTRSRSEPTATRSGARLLTIAVAVATALASGAGAGCKTTPEDHFALARELEAEGRLDEAARHFRKAYAGERTVPYGELDTEELGSASLEPEVARLIEVDANLAETADVEELRRRAQNGDPRAFMLLGVRLDPLTDYPGAGYYRGTRPDPAQAANCYRQVGRTKSRHAAWACRQLGRLVAAHAEAGKPVADEPLVRIPGRIRKAIDDLAGDDREIAKSHLIELGLVAAPDLIDTLDDAKRRDDALWALNTITGQTFEADGSVGSPWRRWLERQP